VIHSVREVREASNRIVDVLSQLSKGGFTPDELHLALIDAGVRMARFYSPKELTTTLLRGISSLAMAMAKDEEAERAARVKRQQKEH